MELINGKNFFRLLLVLALTNCAGEDPNEAKNGIYCKIKDGSDYSDENFRNTDEGFGLRPLEMSCFLYLTNLESDLEELTFYNKSGDLIRRSYYEDEIGDSLYCKFHIRNGKIHGKLSVYRITREILNNVLLYKSGEIITYNYIENLKLEEEVNYYQGIRNGTCRKFNEGHLAQTGKYIFGHKAGDFISYYSNGIISVIEHYTSGGVLNGKRTAYHNDGKIMRIDNYESDHLISSQLFNSSGKLVEERETKNFVTYVRAFDEVNNSFKNYSLEDLGEKIIGNYYIMFDEEGELIGKMDFSEINKRKFTISHPNYKCEVEQPEVNEESRITYTIIASDGTSYVYNGTDNIRHYRGKKLLGDYNQSTKLVNGEFNFSDYRNCPIYLDADSITGLEFYLKGESIDQSDIDRILSELKDQYDEFLTY